MRESIAALALIRRSDTKHGTLWLAQWNSRWNAYHLVGGHKRPDEAFRDCVIREIHEELGLDEGRDFSVADVPVRHIEYTAWSQRAAEETRYVVELFDVELADHVVKTLTDQPPNRWLSDGEIRRQEADNGQPVSKTTQFLLESAGAI